MSTADASVISFRVCAVDDLPLGEARSFMVDGEAICLAHCKDGFRAISDTCSHDNYSLAYGFFDVDTCEVECPIHGSLFSLITGEPSILPATEPVPVYEVTTEGADVMISFEYREEIEVDAGGNN